MQNPMQQSLLVFVTNRAKDDRNKQLGTAVSTFTERELPYLAAPPILTRCFSRNFQNHEVQSVK
jgi:hypothetical protein